MSVQIQKLEAKQVSTEEKRHLQGIPQFSAGDTVVVNYKVREDEKQQDGKKQAKEEKEVKYRVQAFTGVCIAKRNRGLNSAFTLRKISHGVGVERVFQTYSPLIDSIKVTRYGDVRQAKLYYLRGLTGKAARIKEKQNK